MGYGCYGNIRTRPDLSPLFGAMRREDHDRVTDRLLEIEEQLDVLAKEASQHVGVPYKHTGLAFFVRGKEGEIAGGPSGDAGDIWFEIQCNFDEKSQRRRVTQWTIESRIAVFCADLHPKARGYSCTHDLVHLEATTDTPMSAVETLATQINAIRSEVRKREPSMFT